MSKGVIGKLRGLLSSSDDEDTHHGVRLVVGLGNPGGDYAGNRHNLGFWIINRLARRHGLDFQHSGQASLAQGIIHGREIALAKPRTYVNKSGVAVWNLIKRLELDDARELIVACDDLDMPVAKMRIRASGGYGGQNGLRSIIQTLNTEEFPRVRVGVGRPYANGKPSYEPGVVGDYLLSDPPQEERDRLDEAVERAIAAIELVLASGIDAAMQKYN